MLHNLRCLSFRRVIRPHKLHRHSTQSFQCSRLSMLSFERFFSRPSKSDNLAGLHGIAESWIKVFPASAPVIPRAVPRLRSPTKSAWEGPALLQGFEAPTRGWFGRPLTPSVPATEFACLRKWESACWKRAPSWQVLQHLHKISVERQTSSVPCMKSTPSLLISKG
jgi:hypothetical protein